MHLEICQLLRPLYAFSGGPRDTAVEQVSGTGIACAEGLYCDALQALSTGTLPACVVYIFRRFTEEFV